MNALQKSVSTIVSRTCRSTYIVSLSVGRKPYYRQYRPAYRLFHAEFLKSAFQAQQGTIEGKRREMWEKDGWNPHDTLAILDLSVDNSALTVTQMRLHNPPEVPSDRRLRAMFTHHFDDPESRLIEGKFVLGYDVVNLMVSLHQTGVLDGEGLPLYAVRNSYARYSRP